MWHRSPKSSSQMPQQPQLITFSCPFLSCLLALLRGRLTLNLLWTAYLYLDLLRFGLGALLELDAQYTCIIARLHGLGVHGVRHFERAEEAAVTALDAVEVLFLLFLFELALTADGQRAVFDADVEVVFFMPGTSSLRTTLCSSS